MKMPKFELYSKMDHAQMRVTDDRGATKTIQVDRPLYRDMLEVDWTTTHFTIVRAGVIVRGAKLYKEKDYMGKVEERIGFLTHFDVFQKAKKIFEIEERENIFSQYYEVSRNGQVIGKIKPIGVYVPILSNIGKGIEGEYKPLPKEEEELLIMAIISLGV
jgi:hypothetical protein